MTLSYSIVYSRRKTLQIQVKDQKVIVRAPLGTGKALIRRSVEKHEEWIRKALEKQAENKAVEPEISEEEKRGLVRLAKRVLPLKTEYYSKKMGLKYGRITITSARTRFGSCSSKGNISYSYRLLMYPDEAIDYVVVHELAHLAQMNHSARFYRLVASVLPDYKERRDLLKAPPEKPGI